MYNLPQIVNIFTACHISEVVNSVIYSRLRQNLVSFQDDIMFRLKSQVGKERMKKSVVPNLQNQHVTIFYSILMISDKRQKW